MQTLWARVAQVRVSCCCPQCASSAQAVSRRATTSTIRRAPRYWTSSTIWYSGIFAAAATFDAGAKIQRREKWDQAIAEVKQELEVPTEVELRPAGWPAIREGGRPKSDIEVFGGVDALRALERNLDSSTRQRQRPQWPTNTGPELVPHHLPPQSIYGLDIVKAKADSRRWTTKKMEMMQLSMDILQLDLFRALEEAGWSNEAAAAVPSSYAEKILMDRQDRISQLDRKREDLWQLKGLPQREITALDFRRSEGDIPLCQYQQDDLGHYHETVGDLNKSLSALFQLGESKALTTPAMLAKIHHNLSSSSAPPNVDTFNTLIVGLFNAHQTDRVHRVIKTFRKTCARPNEVSISSILRFYTAIDDVDNFRLWVQLMRGKFGGLMEANPDINITPAGEARLLRKPQQPHKIIQLPYPTPMVFGALINGVLKFSGFDAALRICDAMSHEGWGLCISGLDPLLRDCYQRSDWTSGLAVWKQIQALKWKSRKQENGRWVAESIDLSTFATMLRLCLRCNQKSTFHNVMEQAERSHLRAGPKLRDILKADVTMQRGITPTTYRSAVMSPKVQNSAGRPEVNLAVSVSDHKETQRHVASADLVLRSKHSVEQPGLPCQSIPRSDGNAALLHGQLYGHLPGSYELDEYEQYERPMSVTG